MKVLLEACCATVGPLLKAGVGLRCEVAGGVGEADTDQARLRQIVINLLSNAVKFTEKGEVCLRAETERANGRSDLLKIGVSDTGIGIPPEALETIFEEFEQVEGSDPQLKGTGLGLSITKKLAGLLGGTVSVESDVGRGSTFTVRIPLRFSEQDR